MSKDAHATSKTACRGLPDVGPALSPGRMGSLALGMTLTVPRRPASVGGADPHVHVSSSSIRQDRPLAVISAQRHGFTQLYPSPFFAFRVGFGLFDARFVRIVRMGQPGDSR